jgi:hypothetical protein
MKKPKIFTLLGWDKRTTGWEKYQEELNLEFPMKVETTGKMDISNCHIVRVAKRKSFSVKWFKTKEDRNPVRPWL